RNHAGLADRGQIQELAIRQLQIRSWFDLFCGLPFPFAFLRTPRTKPLGSRMHARRALLSNSARSARRRVTSPSTIHLTGQNWRKPGVIPNHSEKVSVPAGAPTIVPSITEFVPRIFPYPTPLILRL